MLFEKIFDDIQKLGSPHDGDLVLFQIEDDQWTAGIHPLLSQKFYADSYEDLELQALEYAEDKSNRGINISVWKKHDFNTGMHFKVL